MGKTKKLYLTRRILAMILAAAMTVTMLPSTALAAPAGDDVEEGIVNVVAEESGDVAAPEDEGEPKDSGDVVSVGDTADDAAAEENKGVDDAATPEDKAGDDAATDAGKAEVNADGDTPAAAVYEISIGDMETKAVYTGYMPFSLNKVKLTKTVNGKTTDVNDEVVTKAWKVQGGDAVDAPINVGVYELTLTCAEKADVHAALTKTVTCEITKAYLAIKASAAAKPGDEAKKANITATVADVYGAEDDSFDWTPDVIALEVTGVREAYGASLTEADILKENGDYVADIKPSIKADAPEAAQNAAKNYELPESLAVNVSMADLVKTQVVVTLTDKWKEAGKVTLHVYDKNEADVPANPEDYDVKVQYWDDTAESAGWKDLAGAEVVGEWGVYDGCKKDKDGKVEAPTNAGEYTYFLTYEDTKEGKYDKYDNTTNVNLPNAVKVVIDPAPVTVEIANTEKLTVPAGTVMTKVLSQVDYKATTKDRKDAERVIKAETEHIWGTGYNDINVSQVYKPAFTLQVKNGSVWENIDDASYRMQSGKTYRVIYDGKKAIYNADGSYAHRTGINSGWDDNGEEINGADSNYLTDETPTADAKALEVEVQAGEEMEWDLTALLADGKAGETPEKATAKDFDNTALYEKKADYKSKVKLKGATKTLDAVGSDFTYKWYKNDAADLLDKQIMDQNKANELSDVDFDNSWNDLGSILAPTDAGIYKLEITYQDKTDDDTLYYVKPDAKGNDKAVVYYVINKIQLTIVPEAGTYETLAGRSPYDYFIREKNIDTIEYKVLKDGNAYTFPESLGKVEPEWGVLENIADQAGEVDTTWYPETTQYRYFSTETGYTYEIQAQDLGRRVYSANGDYNYFSSSSYKIYNNYTLYKGEKKESDVGDKKWAYREDVLLSGKTPLTVNAMGTTELTFEKAATPLAYEKTYDGKALTLAEVKPETAYTLKANGQAVTDLDVKYTCVEKTTYGGTTLLEGLRNAGEYEVYVNFYGDKTYAPLKLEETDSSYGKLIGTVTVKKCQVTLALDVDDTYEAGYMYELWNDISLGFKVTGYVKNEECDHESAFALHGSAWIADYPTFYVNQKEKKTRLYEEDGWILSRGGEFEIHYDADASNLARAFARNYEVQTAAEVLDTFKTVAKPVYVRSASVGSVGALDITAPVVERSAADDITQTIEVREGIPYTVYGSGANQMKGNLAAFAIYAPEEFDYEIPDTAMYENEVEKIGGKVVAKNDEFFVVLFDAATAEGEKKVNIRWADKYYETIIFKMDQKLCLGDLTKAVAPKSLAFNAAPKKLAVGESVQLDVKITKKQMTDVICLGYESSDDTIMHVDPNSGYVTALKKAKATITVYPKEMDKDGNMVKIQGFKPVTVTIEGTAVTAPKSVKVLPHGNYALVNYDRVTDGYRREIYVVDNSKKPNLKKAADIEAEVKKLQGNKNQWRGTFAIAPLYLDSADEDYGRSENGFWYKASLSGLQKETQYTVYVRNVCEAKTLSDGYVITQDTVDAGAAGTAVSFKSLKSEATRLKLELDETLDGINRITTTSNEYVVELSKFAKGLVSKTSGLFMLNESDTAADSGDTIWLELPLKEKKDSYQDPKLEYYVVATDKNGNRVKAAKNNFVSVDKKGKIKLTGVTGWAAYDEEEKDWEYGGGVSVYVRDTNTGEGASIKLVVVADVDSVTAKKKSVNLTVGQTQNLNDIALYTYKAGKTKLSSYQWPDMDMDAVRTAVKEQSDYFELDGTVLRAIKAGGKLKLTLTDKTVKNNAANEKDATAEITFTSKDLAQVKKIKAIDVTNDQFGLTFTSAGYPDAFRVEIRDSSNNLLLDKSYDIDNEADDEAYEVWEMAKDRKAWVRVKDAYRINASTIINDIMAGGKRKLAKESQYTVKITALCGDVASKAATAKVKTTKIPAVSYWLHDNDEYWSWDYQKQSYSWYGRRGGMSIQVSEYGNNWKLDDDNSGLYVLSGNSYTLTAEPTNRGRVNDTLTWTVGNKKVATVKAAAGTYCITLKGMQPGNTTLEVKSKILGKTIARYDIYVAAVGDAYKNGYKTRYYGDDEPADPGESYNPGHDGDNAPEYLPLSVGDARKTKGNYSYFSFTAQETGKYSFIARNGNVYVEKKGTYGWENYTDYSSVDLGWMKEGQTVYLRSQYGNTTSPYYVEIEQTERMESASDGMTVTGRGSQENLEFKAPKAGVYQFTLTDSSDADTKEYLYLYTNFSSMTNGYGSTDAGYTIIRELQKDEVVWLRTAYLDDGKTYTLGTKDVTPAALPSGDVAVPSGSDTVYAFTANAGGIYRLAVTVETAKASDVTLKIWDSALKALKNNGSPLATAAQTADANGKTTKSVDMLLEAGQTVYLNPVNDSEAALTVTVDAKKDDSIKTEISTAGTPINLTADTEVKAVFTASETGIYTFTTGELSNDYSGEVVFKVYNTNGVYDPENDAPFFADKVQSGSGLSMRLGLGAGQMIVWTIKPNAAVDITLKAELSIGGIVELKPGQSAPASVSAGSAAGFIFTAPADGDYSFWSESNGTSLDTYGSLYNIDKVDADTCLKHGTNDYNSLTNNDSGASNGHFGITQYLQKGQTVYLKSMMYYSNKSGSFTVHAAEGYNAWYNYN